MILAQSLRLLWFRAPQAQKLRAAVAVPRLRGTPARLPRIWAYAVDTPPLLRHDARGGGLLGLG